MQDAKRLSPERLEALLAQCVRAWDATREVAGGDVEQVLRAVLEDSGIEAKVSCFAVTPEMLFKIWSSSFPPRVYLLTAIPRDTVSIRPTGNTFAVCHLQDGVHLIDSHRHHTERGCLGMLWARASSLSVLHGWLFNSSGLLEQLHCRTDFLEVVAVAEDGRPAPAAAALGPAGEESGVESEDVVLMEPPVAAVARGAALAAEAARLFPPLPQPPEFRGAVRPMPLAQTRSTLRGFIRVHRRRHILPPGRIGCEALRIAGGVRHRLHSVRPSCCTVRPHSFFQVVAV